MKLISVLTRLSLITLIFYGGYLVFAEQRIVRVCETEVKSIEQSLEVRLDPSSPTLVFRSLSSDPLFSSWLYHAPPDKSFTIQMVTEESSRLATETLLQVPSQPKGHYGIIDIQFNTQGTSPPLIKKLEIHGPNFLKGLHATNDESQYKNPKPLGMAISDKVDLFKTVQDRLTKRPFFFSVEMENSSAAIELQSGLDLILCYFSEEEDAGMPLKHIDHVIRVITDE